MGQVQFCLQDRPDGRCASVVQEQQECILVTSDDITVTSGNDKLIECRRLGYSSGDVDGVCHEAAPGLSASGIHTTSRPYHLAHELKLPYGPQGVAGEAHTIAASFENHHEEHSAGRSPLFCGVPHILCSDHAFYSSPEFVRSDTDDAAIPQCAGMQEVGEVPRAMEKIGSKAGTASSAWLRNFIANDATSSPEITGSVQRVHQVRGLPLVRFKMLAAHRHYKFASCYKVGTKIGEGSFGDVFSASEKKTWCGPLLAKAAPNRGAADSGDIAGGPGKVEIPINSVCSGDSFRRKRHVAVKIITLPRSERSSSAVPSRSPRLGDQAKRTSFETERSMLSRLEHPHIVKVFESFEEQDALYLVLEYCRGGELYGRMAARAQDGRGGKFTEIVVRELFTQMLSACAYLHSLGIVHRDIKTENFLLVGEESKPGENVLKLCDFGSAAQLSEHQPRNMERVGTLSYTAPEVYENRGATVAADLWSLGVVLYVLLTGLNPFRLPDSNTREATVSRIRRGDFDQTRPAWEDISEPAKDLVRSFLVLDEARRISCARALRHPWVRIGSFDEASSSCGQPMDSLDTSQFLPSELPYVSSMSSRRSITGQTHELARYGPQVLQRLVQLSYLDMGHRLLLAGSSRLVYELDLSLEVPWAEYFRAWDIRGEGRLRYGDVLEGLRRCRKELITGSQEYDVEMYSAHRDEAIVLSLDLDMDGRIDWAEWMAVAILDALILRAHEPVSETWSTVFRLLDSRTADGIICSEDLLARIVSTASSGPMAVSPATMADQVQEMLRRRGTEPPCWSFQDFDNITASLEKDPLLKGFETGTQAVKDFRQV